MSNANIDPSLLGDVEAVADNGSQSPAAESFDGVRGEEIGTVDDNNNDIDPFPQPAINDDNDNELSIDEDELDDLNDDSAKDDNNDIFSIRSHKQDATAVTRKKTVRKRRNNEVNVTDNSVKARNDTYQAQEENPYANEDAESRKRRLLEEKMDQAVKSKSSKRRKADEDDLERMQDDKIDFLKDKMIKAANLDVDKNSQGLIATEKLKLLPEVIDTLSKADLAISILDNNLLEAVRLWLEPLPDASMPAYQIQKLLILNLGDLPIKTDHLVASGIGKVLVFYQRSNRTELNLKKIVDQLIGDWTRPILNKSDSYKDRTIQFQQYNKKAFSNRSAANRIQRNEPKTLYEESAERRNRAAIPAARTSAYKIAPKVDPELLNRKRVAGNDETFKKINQRMNFKKKVTKRVGPSIEGRNLAM